MSQPECKDGVCALPARDAPLNAPAAVPGEVPDYMKTLKISALIDSTGAAVAKPPNTPIVALYFSASWCPPCRAFSPVLSDFAAKHATDITVIFVSMDNSEAEMMRFIGGKAFLAIPFSDRTLRQSVRAVRSHDVMSLNSWACA